MTSQLRVYHGIRSPYSRIGMHKIAALELPAECSVRMIPFAAPAAGAKFLNPTSSMPKMGYIMEDAPRMSALMGLKMGMPEPLDIDFAPANRTSVAADRDGKGLAFLLAVSDARWGNGKNISDMGVLSECCVTAGLPADLAERAQSDDSVKTISEENMALVEKDGVFGVPFAAFEKDGRVQKFWGQDRFDLLADALNG